MKKRIFIFSILSLAIATTIGVASASASTTSENTIISQRSGEAQL
ncbi:hypothetical protein [Paenibacillus polymyxa]|nr:hypothetical protein [Paenibacillus polymyxa]